MKNETKCFECGENASVEHHVVPRVMGGINTMPLCSRCHIKIHYLKDSERGDSNSENIKRSLDKHKAWEMFAIYRAFYHQKIFSATEIQMLFKEDFEIDISYSRVLRILKRVKNLSQEHLQEFFNTHIDKDLSYVWYKTKFNQREKLKIDFYEKYKNSGLSMKEILSKVDEEIYQK